MSLHRTISYCIPLHLITPHYASLLQGHPEEDGPGGRDPVLRRPPQVAHLLPTLRGHGPTGLRLCDRLEKVKIAAHSPLIPLLPFFLSCLSSSVSLSLFFHLSLSYFFLRQLSAESCSANMLVIATPTVDYISVSAVRFSLSNGMVTATRGSDVSVCCRVLQHCSMRGDRHYHRAVS